MPLIKSGSKSAVSAKKPQDQAVAIALNTARRYKADGGPVEQPGAVGGILERIAKLLGMAREGAPKGYAPGGWIGEGTSPDDMTRDILPPRPRSPVPEYLLEQQYGGIPEAKYQSMLMDPFVEAAGIGAQNAALGPLGAGAAAAWRAIPKAAKLAGGVGLGASLFGRDKDAGAGEPQADPRAAEIAKLQAEIAKHQVSIAQTIKDLNASKVRGVGEEAGMARTKGLEEAVRPYNDAILKAQERIGQLRGAGDEEKNRLVRAEQAANDARKEEVTRGKPFLEKNNPVAKLYDTFGMFTPAVVAAATGAAGRIAHGPGAKVLPVLEATGFGLTAAHGPTADKAFFSPVDNPQRAGAQAYAQELARANHPDAEKWQRHADDKERYPLINPVRTEGQKEFWDPTKFAERTGLGLIEGISGGLFGSGIGNGVRSGISNLWSGARSGPKPTSPAGSAGGAPNPQGPTTPGSLGTAQEMPIPLTAMPESRMLPSASPTTKLIDNMEAGKSALSDIRPEAVQKGLDLIKQRQLPASSSSSSPTSVAPTSNRPPWATDAPAGVKLKKGYHWDAATGRARHQDDGTFGVTPRGKTAKEEVAKPEPNVKGNEGETVLEKPVGKVNGKEVYAKEPQRPGGDFGPKEEHKYGGIVGSALRAAARYARGGAVSAGPLRSNAGGRTDVIKTEVPPNSFVLPADFLSSLGEDSSAHGHRVWKAIQDKAMADYYGKNAPVAKKQMAAGGDASGKVPILAAGDENIVPPEAVVAFGRGNMQAGLKHLDKMVLDERQRHIRRLAALPPPQS